MSHHRLWDKVSRLKELLQAASASLLEDMSQDWEELSFLECSLHSLSTSTSSMRYQHKGYKQFGQTEHGLNKFSQIKRFATEAGDGDLFRGGNRHKMATSQHYGIKTEGGEYSDNEDFVLYKSEQDELKTDSEVKKGSFKANQASSQKQSNSVFCMPRSSSYRNHQLRIEKTSRPTKDAIINQERFDANLRGNNQQVDPFEESPGLYLLQRSHSQGERTELSLNKDSQLKPFNQRVRKDPVSSNQLGGSLSTILKTSWTPADFEQAAHPIKPDLSKSKIDASKLSMANKHSTMFKSDTAAGYAEKDLSKCSQSLFVSHRDLKIQDTKKQVESQKEVRSNLGDLGDSGKPILPQKDKSDNKKGTSKISTVLSHRKAFQKKEPQNSQTNTFTSPTKDLPSEGDQKKPNSTRDLLIQLRERDKDDRLLTPIPETMHLEQSPTTKKSQGKSFVVFDSVDKRRNSLLNSTNSPRQIPQQQQGVLGSGLRKNSWGLIQQSLNKKSQPKQAVVQDPKSGRQVANWPKNLNRHSRTKTLNSVLSVVQSQNTGPRINVVSMASPSSGSQDTLGVLENKVRSKPEIMISTDPLERDRQSTPETAILEVQKRGEHKSPRYDSIVRTGEEALNKIQNIKIKQAVESSVSSHRHTHSWGDPIVEQLQPESTGNTQEQHQYNRLQTLEFQQIPQTQVDSNRQSLSSFSSPDAPDRRYVPFEGFSLKMTSLHRGLIGQEDQPLSSVRRPQVTFGEIASPPMGARRLDLHRNRDLQALIDESPKHGGALDHRHVIEEESEIVDATTEGITLFKSSSPGLPPVYPRR